MRRYPIGPTALARDGQAAYVFADRQLHKFSLPTGTRECTTEVPEDPYRLYALPTGQGLLAFSLSQVYLLRP